MNSERLQSLKELCGQIENATGNHVTIAQLAGSVPWLISEVERCHWSMLDMILEKANTPDHGTDNIRLRAEVERLNQHVISGHEIMHKEMTAEIERLQIELSKSIDIDLFNKRIGKLQGEVERLQMSSNLLISMHEEVAKLRKQLELCKEQRNWLVESSEGNRLQEIDGLNAELEAIK